jgi:hypothetical protein
MGIRKFTPKLNEGDLIIFNLAIGHGTHEPKKPELTRKAAIFNFFAQNTEFYTPGHYGIAAVVIFFIED